MESVIKATKKILKKEDSGSLKLSVLTKAVVEKIGEKESTDQVKDWILASDKFTLTGKYVALAESSKKRKSDDGDDEKAKKKAAKKAKKEAKKKKKAKDDSSGNKKGTFTEEEVTKWRTENKVVLKSTTDDEEGNKISKELNKNAAYSPYATFDSERVKSSVNEAFLKQCTVVNGFTKPSPIQSQCWPVMLHPGSDGKRRDLVG
jgi:hypothetical protein